jgi:hypothetical protein
VQKAILHCLDLWYKSTVEHQHNFLFLNQNVKLWQTIRKVRAIVTKIKTVVTRVTSRRADAAANAARVKLKTPAAHLNLIQAWAKVAREIRATLETQEATRATAAVTAKQFLICSYEHPYLFQKSVVMKNINKKPAQKNVAAKKEDQRKFETMSQSQNRHGNGRKRNGSDGGARVTGNNH